MKHSATYSEELRAKMARLDDIIGRDHWVSVGSYKEALLRNLIANKAPTAMAVESGFVLSVGWDEKVVKSTRSTF